MLENPETMETETRPRSELPANAKEGDALAVVDGALRIDIAETQTRAARISERFNRLKKR